MFYSLCLITYKICYKNNQHIDYNIHKTTRNLISDRSLDCIGAKITIFERSNMENIEAKVKKVVADKLGIDEATIKDDASFIEDLGADSLDTVELVMALEEEFGCEIPDEDAEKITTVQKAIDYVKAHV